MNSRLAPGYSKRQIVKGQYHEKPIISREVRGLTEAQTIIKALPPTLVIEGEPQDRPGALNRVLLAGENDRRRALANARRLDAVEAAAAVVEPPRARRRHDRIERVEGRELIDAEGNVANPFRAVDTLELMFRRGSIDEAMKNAGNDFRDKFALAQLDALRAADMARTGHGWQGGVPVGTRIQRARDEVWDTICSVGGIASPGGSVLWHVLGWGQSLSDWAALQGWANRKVTPHAAGGILIATLGMLAK